MFKNQIVFYLNKYLGEYVYGLDAESLRISLWQGDVELKNLQLKPEALQKLDLPIHVKAGLLGRLTLKVPWNKLGKEPVVAEFDRLYIVAGPRLEDDDSTAAAAPTAAAGSTTAAAVKQAEQAAKEKRIDAAEQQWVKSLQEKEALAKLQGTSTSSSGGAAAGAGPGGRLQALIDTVVGNLELRISNIHIRYEDPVSNPGQFFAIGLLLEEVSAHTVDERGRRAFVSSDALLTLRKGVELQSLSVYFDCGATPLEPSQPWPSLPTASWDALLLPVNHLPEGYHHGPLLFSTRSTSPSKGLPPSSGSSLGGTHSHPHSRSSSPSRQLLVTSAGTAPFEAPHPGSPKRQGLAGLLPSPAAAARQQHQYLLAPVDGTLTYTRRGAKSRHTERDAHQEVHLALRSISLRLHQQQYVSAQKLLQEFDRYAASAPHRHLRPNCRPSPGVGARLWWRYAIHVVQRQQQRQHYTWAALRKVAGIRRQYVPYYLKLLQQGKQGGDATIAAWDAELDETAALLFRRMARAKYIALKQKSEGSSSGGQRPAQQQQQQTWWGWLRGSSPGAAAAATPPRSPSPALPGASGSSPGPVEPDQPLLDAGEWAALDQLLSEQEAALSKTDDDTPYTVRLRLGVVVDVAAVELQGASGVLLMQGSLDAVEGCVTSYPVTNDITLKMGMFGINSAHGPLVSSGLITGAATAGGSEGSPAPQQQQRKAMDLHVVRQPQDGTADLQVTVKLAPSYVTYKQAAIAEVQKFFSSGEQQLELSALQAQAAARADKLRRMAQTQLNAMSKRNAAQKPRLQLKMTLNAPKIAIPSADEQTTLVADLGCFMFDSDPGLLASLSAEEAAVYECFTVKVDHVSAYLLEGAFAWPTAEEVLEAPARAGSTASTAASRLRPSSSASSLSTKAAAAATAAAGAGQGTSAASGLPSAASGGAPQQERGLQATYSSGSGMGEGRRGGGSGLMEALAQRCKLVTLLERFGAGMDLQVATSMHPRYPVLRLAVNASPIRLHLSPHRFQHLMAVLMSLGGPADAAAAAAAAGPTKPLWLTDAEYATKVSVLTAETMVGSLTSGGSAARWSAKRWLYVWRGRLYLTAGATDVEPLVTKTYWRGYKVVLVPPKVLKGDEHAVAILPQGFKVEGLAEVGDALVLRVRDASAAAELRKKLVQSGSQMAAVAGLLQMSDTSDDAGAIGTTHDVFEELLSHQLLLELSGTIPEVQLLVGGRSPTTWWPPSSTGDGGMDPGASVGDNLSLHSGGSSMDIDAGTAAALAAAGPGSMSERPPRRPLSSSSSFSRSVVSQGAASAAQAALLAAPGGPSGTGLTSLEEEVDLVAIRFQGARVNFVMGGDGMRVDVVMRALQIDDLLVGARNPAKAHLARSEVVQRAGSSSGEDPGAIPGDLPDMPSQGSFNVGEGSQAGSLAEDEEEDEFFDAEEGPATPRTPSRAARRSSGGGSSASASGSTGPGASSGTGTAAGGGEAAADALRPASVSGNPQGDLVRLCFVRIVPTSSRYTGTDVELVLQLSSLVFYCHRPTVAALMVFGTDLGAISSQLAGPAAPEAPAEAQPGPEEGGGPDGSSTADTESVADTQLVRSGGEARTMFKLALLVSKVELHLDYEGFTSECMAIGAMQDFAFHLSVHPATLALTASLGNLVAEYGALPPGHPNRTILTMREGTSGSLIDVEFKLHSLAESFSQPRVPPGLPFMSVATRLSTVQVVFMQRFLNEFLAYLAVMFAMQPPPKVLPGQAPAAATAEDATPPPPPAAASSSATAAAAGPQPSSPGSSVTPQASAGAPALTGDTGSSGDTSDAQVTPPAPPAANPLILLLDVVLEAPVIVMPLASGSQDHMEVDLGTLEVSNRVMWEVKGQGAARQRLLLDQLQVKLSKVSGCVVADGQRGRNVIREMGGGIRVAVVRPLLAEPLPAPPLSTDLTVPQLRLSLLDTEYKLILDILAANFSEPSALPPEVAYLHQKLLVAPAASPAAGTGTPAGGSPEPVIDVDAKPVPPAAGGGPPAAQQEEVPAAAAALEAKREAVRRFTTSNAALLQLLGDVCTVRVTVKIGAAQLMLWNKQQDGSAPLPLGGIQLSNMWLGLALTRGTNMLLSLSLPVVFVRDMRPGVPPEASLVLSTAGMGSGAEGPSAAVVAVASGGAGDPSSTPALTSSSSSRALDAGSAGGGAVATLLPSLLTLEYRAVRSLGPELVSGLQVRLQRPTLVLDIAFIMRVLHFVVPAVGTQGPQTRPYATHEVHLGAQPYLADAHLWLSPEYRIIADAPGVREFVYDGRGHALVLPAGLPATEHVPLIVVGRNKVLRLRNVKVANAGALAAVLDLGPGARLVADPGEGVKMVEEEAEGALGKRYQRFMSSLRASQRRRGSLDGSAPAAGAAPRAASPGADASGGGSSSGAAGSGPDPAAVPATMDIHLSAVGAAIYLLDARSGATSSSSATTTTASSGRPGPGGSAPDVSRLASTASMSGSGQRAKSEGSLLGAAGGAAAAGGDAAGAELLYMLAVALDLGLDYQMRPTTQHIRAELLNLCIKAQARLLENSSSLDTPGGSPQEEPLSPATASATSTTSAFEEAQAAAAAAATRGAGEGAGALRQSVAVNILDPVNLVVNTWLSPDRQAVDVEMSALRVKLSPDVLQLILHLQKVVLEPLVVPPATAPVVRCSSYERLWSSYCPGPAAAAISGPWPTAGAGGVDVMAAAKGVTVWRPQPPMGYAILGDVLTAGSSQPDHQVLVVAINSGLVTHPVGYTQVWSSNGIVLWRPNPPPGYVAMGCIATLRGTSSTSSVTSGTAASDASAASPPPLRAMVVVAQQAAVEALAGACMLYTSAGNLWSVQNSAATFDVSPGDSHCPGVTLYDLRSPLGVPPAALSSSAPAEGGVIHLAGLVQVPPSLLAARHFKQERAQLRAAISSAGQVTYVVEFERVWWDKYAKHPSDQGVSFWRPKAPPGYVALGDVVSAGHYAPPCEVLVVRDNGHDEGLTGPPPLAYPVGYRLVWQDDHKRNLRDPNYLCLWEPIPPPGFVAAGMVATTGGGSLPPNDMIRCLRADLASRADASAAVTMQAYKERQPMRVWLLDERCATFCLARGGEERPSSHSTWRLRPDVDRDQLEAGRRGAAGGAPGAVPRAKRDISLRLQQLNLLLRNMLRTPVLEFEARGPAADAIKMGLFSEPTGVTRSFAQLTSSIWSYNPRLEVWEPVITPWQLLVKCDHNPNVVTCEGVSPGTQLDIKSTMGDPVHVTLAHAAIGSIFDVLTDWQGTSSSSGGGAKSRTGLAAADGLTVDTTVTNTLDESAYMQLDFGDRKEVVALPARATVTMHQPVPQVPQSHAPISSQLAPPVRLLVDVVEGRMPAGLAAAGSTPELFVKVELVGLAAQKATVSTAPGQAAEGQPPARSRSGGALAAASLAQPELGPDGWGLTTRAIAPTAGPVTPAASGGTTSQQQQAVFVFPWRERFMVTLPQNLTENLLSPAPGDNPFAGVTDQLRVSVWDASAAGGVGGLLATKVLPLQYNWLQHELQQALLKRQAAGSSGTGAAGAAGGGSGPPGLQRAASSKHSNFVTLSMELTGDPATAAAAAAGGGGPAAGARPPAESEGGQGLDPAAAFQLRMALRIDDSQVDPSWFPKRREQQQAALVAAAAAAQGSSTSSPGSAPGSNGLGASGRGWQAALATRHALRLAEGAVWCPFSWSNLQRTSGGGALGGHSAVLPIKGIARGLALEVEYAVGAYHVQLRSLCCFFNDTDMALEVALLEDSDSSYTMVPHASSAGSFQSAASSGSLRGTTSSSSARAVSGALLSSTSTSGGAAATPAGSIAKDTCEERLFEFERYMPFASPGWSAAHLLPADPKHWSQLPKGGHSSNEQPLVPLPQGWEWEGPWEVEHHPCVDAEGWAYAFDFPHLHWPPEPGDGIPKPIEVVRRRAWLRRRRRVALPSTVLDVSTGSTTSASGAAASSTGAADSSTPGVTKPGQPALEVGDGWTRRVLGVVEPGGRLPLPHTWQRDNTLNSKQLQVRPVIGAAAMRAAAAGGGVAGAASHSWSYGASQGHHSVLLTGLEDGDTRLLCCKTLSVAPAGEEADVLSPKRATAHAPAAWLAALCECTPLRLPGGLDTVPDWRVTVRPPLHLVNDLPVAAHYQLWEGGNSGGPGGLQLRQQGRLEGGEGINVYSVDMRRQIYLQFYPEGGQWVDRGPVLISGGFQSDAAGMAGTAGDPPLPPTCLVNYSNSTSTMGLRLGITRELDQELVDSQRLRMAATRAAAAGGSGASGGASGAAAAAAAVQKVAAQGMDAVKLSFGSALAQGRVLTLRLSVPAWVVNGTQMPVTLGLVPITSDTSASGAVLVSESTSGVQETLSRSESGVRRRRSRASGAGGGTSGVLVNDAVLGPNELNPVAVVTVMPNSVELLSAPQLTAQQQSEGGDTMRWAAALCMEGSRWTKAIPLLGGMSSPSSATNAAAAAVANAAATAGSAVEGSLAPLLVRARCRDGCLHEMVAQVHQWGSGLQQAAVLHLSPHIVVTNRTGYPLLLLQTEPLRQAMSGAAAAAAMAGAGYGQYMVPGQYGPQYRAGSGTALAGSGGSGAWFPGPAGAPGGRNPSDFHPTWIPSPAAAQRMAAEGLLQPAPLSGAGAAPGLHHPAVTLVRPGSVGLPVAWQPLAAERQLSIMLPPAKVAAGAPLDALMWSAPFTVRDNMEPLQLLLPAYRLGTPGEPQAVDDASRAAALRELDAMLLPAATAAAAAGGRGGQVPGAGGSPGRAGSPTPAPSTTTSSTRSSTSGGRGPGTAPLLVEMQKDMEAGMQGYLAVVLQLKVEERGPGCLHLILESLGGEPEHLIQNCLPAPLCYRQDTSTASWQQLPPLSAAALVLQQPPGAVPGASAAPAPPVVEVRDADPGTSGGGTVRLDDLGAGGAALPAAFAGRGSMAGEGEGGRGTSGADQVFRQELAVGNRRALALVSPLYEAIMAGGGPQEVPGGGAVPLGGTATDRALRVVPKQGFVSAHQLHLAAALSGKDRASTSPGSRVALALELGALDVSLVDAAPRELLLVTLEGLGGAVALGNTLGTPFQAVALRLASIQVDDMLQGTPFPVLLTCSTTARRNSSGGAEGGPALQLEVVRQPERIKGLMYLPTFVFRAAPLQLSISENLVWALLDFGSSLGSAAGSSSSSSSGGTAGAAAGGGGGGSAKGGVTRTMSYSQLGSTTSQTGAAGRPAQQPSSTARGPSASSRHQAVSAASADVPLYVNLLSLDEVKVTVNVRADRARRPRWAAAKYPILGTLGDLLNVEDLEVMLPELEFENERLLRGRLVGQLVSQMQGQLLGLMFNVLKSYGVLGGGARFMSVVGTMMQNTVDPGAAAAAGPGRGEVSNMGQAFLEGGKTFGKSLLKGVTGIVTNPLEGAEKQGFLGFAKGVGKGIIGVPMTITGGAVLAAAQVAEGFDATMGQVKEAVKDVTGLGTVDDRVPRRRLPRAIRGDRVLTVYARRPAAGQALLFTCGPVPSLLQQRGGGVLGGMMGSGGSMSGSGPSISSSSGSSSGLGLARRWMGDVEDAYEGHEVLIYAQPNGDVVLLTSARVMLVRAEEFAGIQDNPEVTKVPAGVVQWQLTWDQLLTTELYSLPGCTQPAGVLLHRRQRGPEPEGRIAHHIPCWGPDPMAMPPGATCGTVYAEAAAQAARLQQAIVATRARYYLSPRREVQGWSAVPVTAVEQQPNQAMPDTIPCMHYKQVWTYNRPGRRPLTIWRPQGPPGYWPLGDVAMPGTEPPAAPVKVYREASSSSSTSSGGATGSSRRPPLAAPSSFQLLFRDSRTGHPVTIWRPLPPSGYVVLGDVVVPAIDEPPAECVRCLRADLARPSRFFDSNVWAEASSDNTNMLAALWQVDNACHTFVATRGSSEQALRPTNRQPLAPAY